MIGARQLLARWVESHDAGFPGGAVRASKVCEDTRRFLDDGDPTTAGALDVERLARVLEDHQAEDGKGFRHACMADCADEIAAAYAAASSEAP